MLHSTPRNKPENVTPKATEAEVHFGKNPNFNTAAAELRISLYYPTPTLCPKSDNK